MSVDRVPATTAKNEFGRLLDDVIAGSRVLITKYDRPRAVLMSIEEYEQLASPRGKSLAELGARYDTWLNSVQGESKSAARERAFRASPAKIGRAAAKRAGRSDS